MSPQSALERFYAYLFGRPTAAKMNRMLARFAFRGLGVGNYESPGISGESWLLRDCSRRFSNPTVIDIGANIGDYTFLVKKLMPEARVHAFEPSPKNFVKLSNRYRNDKCVATYQIAASNEAGIARLFDRIGQGSEHASLCKAVFEEIHRCETDVFEVSTVTLDDFTSQKTIDHVHLLKIDTEGHELDVLRGCMRLIRENRISCIQFEHGEMARCARVFVSDYAQLLPNWTLYRLLPYGLLPLHGQGTLFNELYFFQNIVALPPAVCPPR